MPVQLPLSPDPAAPLRPAPASPAAAPGRTRRTTLRLDIDSVHVRPWVDPVVAARGHDARSAYVERYWLPVLGPSATLFLRHLAAGFEGAPEGYDLDLTDAAAALGMAGGGGASGGFRRMLDRVQSFGFAQLVDGDTLVARTHLPPLTRRQLGRLPLSLQVAHDAEESARRAASVHAEAVDNRAVAGGPGGDAA